MLLFAGDQLLLLKHFSLELQDVILDLFIYVKLSQSLFDLWLRLNGIHYLFQLCLVHLNISLEPLVLDLSIDNVSVQFFILFNQVVFIGEEGFFYVLQLQMHQGKLLIEISDFLRFTFQLEKSILWFPTLIKLKFLFLYHSDDSTRLFDIIFNSRFLPGKLQ